MQSITQVYSWDLSYGKNFVFHGCMGWAPNRWERVLSRLQDTSMPEGGKERAKE